MLMGWEEAGAAILSELVPCSSQHIPGPLTSARCRRRQPSTWQHAEATWTVCSSCSRRAQSLTSPTSPERLHSTKVSPDHPPRWAAWRRSPDAGMGNKDQCSHKCITLPCALPSPRPALGISLEGGRACSDTSTHAHGQPMLPVWHSGELWGLTGGESCTCDRGGKSLAGDIQGVWARGPGARA